MQRTPQSAAERNRVGRIFKRRLYRPLLKSSKGPLRKHYRRQISRNLCVNGGGKEERGEKGRGYEKMAHPHLYQVPCSEIHASAWHTSPGSVVQWLLFSVRPASATAVYDWFSCRKSKPSYYLNHGGRRGKKDCHSNTTCMLTITCVFHE